MPPWGDPVRRWTLIPLQGESRRCLMDLHQTLLSTEKCRLMTVRNWTLAVVIRTEAGKAWTEAVRNWTKLYRGAL